MTEIFLVRHGETEWNADQRVQGHTNSNLSDLGRRQAEAVATRLCGTKFDAIYSSDLCRAMDTAKAIAAAHGLPVQSSEALREKNYGHWEGRTIEEVKTLHPDEWRQYHTMRDVGFRIPGGEIWQEVRERVVAFLHDVLVKHKGEQSILLAGHGGSVRLAILHAMGAPLTSLSRLKLDNCGLTRLSYDGDGNGRVIFLNDTSHLAEITA